MENDESLRFIPDMSKHYSLGETIRSLNFESDMTPHIFFHGISPKTDSLLKSVWLAESLWEMSVDPSLPKAKIVKKNTQSSGKAAAHKNEDVVRL